MSFDQIKYVVVYGDSYSDLQPGTKRTNGPLWSQQLATQWGTKLASQAKIGATFCRNSIKNGSWLQRQVENTQLHPNSNTKEDDEEGSGSVMHIIFMGVTDLINTKTEAGEHINEWLQCIKDQVVYIQTKDPSARIIIMGVPALEFSPYALSHKDSTFNLKQNIIDFNVALEEEVLNWQQQQIANNIEFFDTYLVFSDVLGDPAGVAHIENVDDAYWDVCQGQCADNVDGYLWWDSVHITGSGHAAIAKAIKSKGFVATGASSSTSSTAAEASEIPQPYIRFVSWFILLSIVAMVLFMLRHNRVVVSMRKKLQMKAAKIYPSFGANRTTHEYTLV